MYIYFIKTKGKKNLENILVILMNNYNARIKTSFD